MLRYKIYTEIEVHLDLVPVNTDMYNELPPVKCIRSGTMNYPLLNASDQVQ